MLHISCHRDLNGLWTSLFWGVAKPYSEPSIGNQNVITVHIINFYMWIYELQDTLFMILWKSAMRYKKFKIKLIKICYPFDISLLDWSSISKTVSARPPVLLTMGTWILFSRVISRVLINEKMCQVQLIGPEVTKTHKNIL